MFAFVFWMVFGALIGWTTGLLSGATKPRVILIFVALGVVGGLLGGLVSSWLAGVGEEGYSSDLTSMMFAIAGAVIIIVLLVSTYGKGRGLQ